MFKLESLGGPKHFDHKSLTRSVSPPVAKARVHKDQIYLGLLHLALRLFLLGAEDEDLGKTELGALFCWSAEDLNEYTWSP